MEDQRSRKGEGEERVKMTKEEKAKWVVAVEALLKILEEQLWRDNEEDDVFVKFYARKEK